MHKLVYGYICHRSIKINHTKTDTRKQRNGKNHYLLLYFNATIKLATRWSQNSVLLIRNKDKRISMTMAQQAIGNLLPLPQNISLMTEVLTYNRLYYV